MIRLFNATSWLVLLTFCGVVWCQETPVVPITPPADATVPATSESVSDVIPGAVPGTGPDDGSPKADSSTGPSPNSVARERLRRDRSRPSRGARVPQELFGQETEESPPPKDTLLGGSTPAIWEIERSNPMLDDENLPSLLERDTAVPTVPGKVVRYAVWLMRHYDLDGDGVLQEEEWKKMPGSPQAMDINGDSLVSLDELVRFLAFYGQERTIHRPHPTPRYYQPAMASSQFQIFRPISAPPAPSAESTPPVPEENASESPEEDVEGGMTFDPSVDQTEESLEAADEPIVDDETYEKIFAKHGIPAIRKYHTPSEALRGVPAWFLLLDRDGDGQVSLLEFAPTLSPKALALFGKLDKNGDGFITPDEVRNPLPIENPPGPE